MVMCYKILSLYVKDWWFWLFARTIRVKNDSKPGQNRWDEGQRRETLVYRQANVFWLYMWVQHLVRTGGMKFREERTLVYRQADVFWWEIELKARWGKFCLVSMISTSKKKTVPFYNQQNYSKKKEETKGHTNH